MNLSPKCLIKILEENGFVLKRSKGSHFIFFNPNSKITIPVPVHSKDMKKGTFLGILKEAGIDKKEI
jgi:predicted RNA binding protein YcfA (HicA-like mRNA interferase family)